jgi:hypothetical protein
MATYTSVYPSEQNDTYVKATTKFNTTYWQYYATDPTKSLTGSWSSVSWIAEDNTVTNQRFHIDLGSGHIIRRIYYENGHNSGSLTNSGVQNFTLWGSNNASAFAELTYATDTGWTQLTTSASVFEQHTGSDIADPKYITVTNTNSYRYYALKFADNYTNAEYMNVRRIELQTEDGFSAGGAGFFLFFN